jgi:hypothetical protein
MSNISAYQKELNADDFYKEKIKKFKEEAQNFFENKNFHPIQAKKYYNDDINYSFDDTEGLYQYIQIYINNLIQTGVNEYKNGLEVYNEIYDAYNVTYYIYHLIGKRGTNDSKKEYDEKYDKIYIENFFDILHQYIKKSENFNHNININSFDDMKYGFRSEIFFPFDRNGNYIHPVIIAKVYPDMFKGNGDNLYNYKITYLNHLNEKKNIAYTYSSADKYRDIERKYSGIFTTEKYIKYKEKINPVRHYGGKSIKKSLKRKSYKKQMRRKTNRRR